MRALIFLLVLVTIEATLTQNPKAQSESAQVNPPYEKTNLSSTHVTSLLTLPNGLLAGEFDARPWLNPYNGIYLSRDLGDSWTELGLAGRGVTDLAFDNDLLLASTYYHIYDSDGVKKVGLFISNDKGKTFKHAGLNFSTSQVEASNETIYLGGYSHGLWVSKDDGLTWQQKIGDSSGWTGPSVKKIFTNGEVALVSTTTQTYLSLNAGESFTPISALNGVQIASGLISGEHMFLGTSNNTGVYVSSDMGQNWVKLVSWQNLSSTLIYKYGDFVYMHISDSNNDKYTTYRSNDYGANWYLYNSQASNQILAAAPLYSYPTYFFLVEKDFGVMRETLLPQVAQESRFLDIPWEYESEQELVEKLTAYFDHNYPLAYYSYWQEPEESKQDTLNFLGLKESTPFLYYSGHDGSDFALPYGTSIKAPANGEASYFYCKGCGNAIKIDHKNGFQTSYLHLQENGLFTKTSKPILKGEQVGLVGMTGNTSGPHLHFSILYDKDSNGKFDDFPNGLVDPYGWNNPYSEDPWATYSWTDALGEHTGTESKSLWLTNFEHIYKYINDFKTLTKGNKKIIFDSQTLYDNTFTTMLSNFIRPLIPLEQSELAYVEGTSFILSAHSSVGSQLKEIGNVNIEIVIDKTLLDNIKQDTIGLFFWNELTRLWQKLESTFDQNTSTLRGCTTHFSHFVVLGEKIVSEPPQSTAKITGNMIDGIYTEYPLFELSSQSPSNTGLEGIFYTINEEAWQKYEEPFRLEQDGNLKIEYRAVDIFGNLEQTKAFSIEINTLHTLKSKASIIGSEFKTIN